MEYESGPYLSAGVAKMLMENSASAESSRSKQFSAGQNNPFINDGIRKKGFPPTTVITPQVASSQRNNAPINFSKYSFLENFRQSPSQRRYLLPKSVWPSDLESLNDLDLIWRPFSPLPVLLSECISEMKWQEKYFLLTQIFSENTTQGDRENPGMNFKTFESVLHCYPCIERAYIRELFSFMDCQRNGIIQETDFISGLLVSSPEAPHLSLGLKQSRKSFKTMVERITGLRPTALIRLQLIFLTFDCDGDAILNVEELARLLCRILSILCNEKFSGRLCLEEYSREAWQSKLGRNFWAAVSNNSIDEESNVASRQSPERFSRPAFISQDNVSTTVKVGRDNMNNLIIPATKNIGEFMASSLKKLFGLSEQSEVRSISGDSKSSPTPNERFLGSLIQQDTIDSSQNKTNGLSNISFESGPTTGNVEVQKRERALYHNHKRLTQESYQAKEVSGGTTPTSCLDNTVPWDECTENKNSIILIRNSPELTHTFTNQHYGSGFLDHFDAVEEVKRNLSCKISKINSNSKTQKRLGLLQSQRKALNEGIVKRLVNRDEAVTCLSNHQSHSIQKISSTPNMFLTESEHCFADPYNNKNEPTALAQSFNKLKGLEKAPHPVQMFTPRNRVFGINKEETSTRINKDVMGFECDQLIKKTTYSTQASNGSDMVDALETYDAVHDQCTDFRLPKVYKINEVVHSATFNSNFSRMVPTTIQARKVTFDKQVASEAPELVQIDPETLIKWKQRIVKDIARRLTVIYDAFGDNRGLCFSMFVQAVLKNDIPGTSVLFRTRQDICAVIRNKKISTEEVKKEVEIPRESTLPQITQSRKKGSSYLQSRKLEMKKYFTCRSHSKDTFCNTQASKYEANRYKSPVGSEKNDMVRGGLAMRHLPSFPRLRSLSPEISPNCNTPTPSGCPVALSAQCSSSSKVTSFKESSRMSDISSQVASLEVELSTPRKSSVHLSDIVLSEHNVCPQSMTPGNTYAGSEAEVCETFPKDILNSTSSEESYVKISEVPRSLKRDCFENSVENAISGVAKGTPNLAQRKSLQPPSPTLENFISTPSENNFSNLEYGTTVSPRKNVKSEESCSDSFSPLQILQELVKTHEQHLRLARRVLAAVVTIKFEGWDGPCFTPHPKESVSKWHKSPLLIPGIERSPLYILQAKRNDSGVKLLPLDLLYQLCDAVVHILRDEPKHVKVSPPVATVSNLLVKNFKTNSYSIHPLVEQFTHGFEGDFHWKVKKKKDTKRLILFGSVTASTGPHEMLELIVYVFALKLLYPTTITLLRGPFDDYLVSVAFGFAKECTDRYGIVEGKELHRRLSDVLEFLPICCTIENISHNILCLTGDLPDESRLGYFHSLKTFSYKEPIPSLVIHTLQACTWESGIPDQITDHSYSEALMLCFELIWSQEFMKAFNTRTQSGLVDFTHSKHSVKKESDEDNEWQVLFSKRRFFESQRFNMSQRAKCFHTLGYTYILRILPTNHCSLTYNLVLESSSAYEPNQTGTEAYFSSDTLDKIDIKIHGDDDRGK